MPAKEQAQINQHRHLIGISNTFDRNGEQFKSAHEVLAEVIKNLQIVLIPYAMTDMDKALSEVSSTFLKLGALSVISSHQFPREERKLIENADAIYISGGNTGRLVANLHALRHYNDQLVDKRPGAAQFSLVNELRAKAAEGIPIIGASAGFSVMSADVRTTNDMQSAVQYIEPGKAVLRIDSLGLLPEKLSTNAHYYKDKVNVSEKQREEIIKISEDVGVIIDHQGESRDERLTQILEMDPERTILAIPENCYVEVKGMHMEYHGTGTGFIFKLNEDPVSVKDGENLDFLLKV